jgi:hypothetical protein
MVTRRQVRRAIELHEAELSALNNVVGIGAHWDTTKEALGEDPDHAVAVYVSSVRARAKGDLAKDAIPQAIEIPGRRGVHVIPIVVKEIGEIRPEVDAEAERPEDGELFSAE